MKSTLLLPLLHITSTLAANHFAGIGASNAIGNNPIYTCRTPEQWVTYAQDAKNAGFPAIRITGFDCSAIELAASAANGAGVGLLAGVYITGSVADSLVQIDNDVQRFVAVYQIYGPSLFVGLTIGNEALDTADNIMAKVWDVRGYLQSLGITTPVATVHTWIFIRDYPIMCGGDFVGANAHAFYDPPSTDNTAGAFLASGVVPALQAVCPQSRIIITETGWPSSGLSIGHVLPSTPTDETSALSVLNCAALALSLPPFSTGVGGAVQVYAFEYDDSLWKTTDAERSYGIFTDVAGVMKDGLGAFADAC